MKAVILAGGFGTRLSEETDAIPKPMVRIGDQPMLWHIMKIYASHGIREFVICLGYKGYVIKEYFSNYFLHTSDVTIDLESNHLRVHERHAEPWSVTLVDTGLNSMTGGRLRRVREYLGEERFCFTYGDGLADVDLGELLRFHDKNGLLATVTAVRIPSRFGTLNLAKERVDSFSEKPMNGGGWINGGFFVLEPQAIDLIEHDQTIWEREPLEALAQQGELGAFRHRGFWQPMDTLRDRRELDAAWRADRAPWRIW